MRQFIKFLEKLMARRRIEEEAAFERFRQDEERKYEALKREIDACYTRAEAKRPKPRPPVPNGSH